MGQQNLEETIKSLKLPSQAKGGLQKFLEPSKIKDPMYHGTTADIREFKPDRAGATYLTSDPNFASKFALNDMLYGSGLEDQSGFINPGANIMKVHVQATNPFDFDNPKHVRAVLSNLDERDKKAFRKIIKNKTGDNWRGLENFMHIIEDTGFDSAYLREMGRKNLAVLDPRKIKSAISNRGTYDINDPDITKAKGGSIKEPEKTVTAYKLFRVHPKHHGKLFPLFVNANEPVEMNKWVEAKEGEMAGDKVKSKIGPLAYRPGWHAGDLPIATHIGEKSDPSLTAPDIRPANHVWAEVEMPNDVDWQSVANKRGTNAKGKLIARDAHITDQIPKGGHYRYKTNSNMTGNWLIGGAMKVKRVLHDKEVKAINKAAGVSDLPRTKPFKAKDYGFASGGLVAPDEWKAEEHVNYMSGGGSVMGINVASDKKAGRRYADLIVDGHKTLESRNSDSLRPYVGKRVAIVRTGEGKAKAIGEVTIGEPMVVNSKKFRELEHKHMVPKGSAYDISTPTKHLYPLHDPMRYEEDRDVGHGIVSRKMIEKAEGGEVDAAMYRTKEPELTLGEKYNKYVAPLINSGLNTMLPMRKLAGIAFEQGVHKPIVNFVKKNPNELNKAQVESNVEEYHRMKVEEQLRKAGLPTIPREYDVSRFTRKMIPNSFPNPDNPIDAKNLRDMTDLLKAKGGSIPSLDAMRYELLNRKPAHLAIGGQGPRNWLKGSVEQTIEGLKSKLRSPEHVADLEITANDPQSVAREGAQARIRQHHHEVAINQWVDRNLTNYIKKQMATHNDPIRKLAEEGIIHIPTEQVGINRYKADDVRRTLGGEKLAKSPEAEAWEDATDVVMGRTKVKNIGSLSDQYREPWHEKADPETPLYYPNDNMHASYLGFDHIVDILKEDLEQGRIRPEQLSKVSIEHAVRRAHEYDQERKKAMAETALKATEGMPTHKDYGDGYKWIELTTPALENEIPPTHNLEQYESKVHGTGYRVRNKETGMAGEGWKTPERATQEFLKSHAEDKLAEALKYEGDTMGHCVGGYCPDVASGKTRIFSLRDAKNEPHVTIEVQPIPKSHWDKEKWFGQQSSELQQKINEEVKELGEQMGGIHKNYAKAFADVIDRYTGEQPSSIKQIKGKGNAKPKKDYIPYVQDFVKSGNWSDVGDIKNAEMIKHKGQYLTHQEHDDWLLNQLKPDNKARGGRVTHAHHLQIEERPL